MNELVRRLAAMTDADIADLDANGVEECLTDVARLRQWLDLRLGELIVTADRQSAVGDWRRVDEALGGSASCSLDVDEV